MKLNKEQKTMLEDKITINVLTEVITKQIRLKLPGPDEVPVEVYKNIRRNPNNTF